ncbi:hypothetical protein M514_12073 [Trichuris suis]|uniref:Uncharacterized protein n=1 Tax=Trichuris suis TaxID=68888 RepID=A0A085MVW7_9BILA|nr:hypothetical protein M513_12073 [Trichuris suis]KFD61363.1 hypothetical protein M514_12073 [Trichuris suis]KHJ40267.1 hypothetical protein D918_09710 [Trichuris suis]
MVQERPFNPVFFAIGLLLSTPTGMIWGNENFVVYSDPEKGRDVGSTATTVAIGRNETTSKALKLGHGNQHLNEEQLEQMQARKEIGLKNMKSLMPTIIDLFTKSMNAATVFYKSRFMKKSEGGANEQLCQKAEVLKDRCNSTKSEDAARSTKQKTPSNGIDEVSQKERVLSKENSDSTRSEAAFSAKISNAMQEKNSEAVIHNDFLRRASIDKITKENFDSTKLGAAALSAKLLNATQKQSVHLKEPQISDLIKNGNSTRKKSNS